MLGLRGPRSGLLIKKPSEFWASDALLVKHLRNKRCDGQHEHAQLDEREPGGPVDQAKGAQRWPLPLCHAVAKGGEE